MDGWQWLIQRFQNGSYGFLPSSWQFFVLPVSIVCFRYHLYRAVVVPVTIQEPLTSKAPQPVDLPRPCVTSWVLLTLPVLSIASPPPPSVQSGARISIRLRSGMRDSSFNAVQLSNFAGARSEPRIQLVPESPVWPPVRTGGPRLCKAPWPISPLPELVWAQPGATSQHPQLRIGRVPASQQPVPLSPIARLSIRSMASLRVHERLPAPPLGELLRRSTPRTRLVPEFSAAAVQSCSRRVLRCEASLALTLRRPRTQPQNSPETTREQADLPPEPTPLLAPILRVRHSEKLDPPSMSRLEPPSKRPRQRRVPISPPVHAAALPSRLRVRLVPESPEWPAATRARVHPLRDPCIPGRGLETPPTRPCGEVHPSGLRRRDLQHDGKKQKRTESHKQVGRKLDSRSVRLHSPGRDRTSQSSLRRTYGSQGLLRALQMSGSTQSRSSSSHSNHGSPCLKLSQRADSEAFRAESRSTARAQDVARFSP